MEMGNIVTRYTVNVKIGPKNWTLEYRFSEFYNLHMNLKKQSSNLPSFPKRGIFATTKPESIEKRRAHLEDYLSKICQKTEVFANENFLDFLQFHKHKTKVGIKKMEQIGNINHGKMGFRDVILLNEKKMFFSITSEMNVLSRFESYTMNISLPFEKKKPVIVVGLVEAWV